MRLEPISSPHTGRLHRPGFSLPPELLEKAVTRLRGVGIIAAISPIVFFALNGMLQPEIAAAQMSPVVRLVTLAMVLLSVAFLVVHRAGVFSSCTIAHLGGVFEVVVAFFIAMTEMAVPLASASVVRGISSLALWIALCGLLIPSTPTMNLLGGLSIAAMWPAAYFLNVSMLGHPWIGWNRVAAWCFPLLLTVVWSNLINRRIYRIEVDNYRAQELGSYKLESIIGRGGMGEVWRARHRMLARDAAVKLIRPEMLVSYSVREADMLNKRFEREAQATAQLRSPHTVALYDFGVSRDGAFYYVMELLDGIDLQTLVERYGPLSPGRVKSILIQACESLEEAHRRGMVHRDIKPRNLLLCTIGLEFDFVKVLDFGLVKLKESEDGGTQMTREGSISGTPAFMAPEMVLARGPLDGRADIYSLGCVAYYLLTGQLVFDEPTGMAAALAHVQQEPVPPSRRTELTIPASLDRIVMQCLDKDPEKRPESAWELARRLEASADVPRFCRDAAERWWRTHAPAPAMESAVSADAEETQAS